MPNSGATALARASRVAVLGSTILCALAYAYLTASVPWLAASAAMAFALTFGLSYVSERLGLVPLLATAYLAPVGLTILFGQEDYHLLIVWMAGLAGAVFALSGWREWHAPPPWRLPIAGWALVVALTWPIIAGREIDFSLIALHTQDTSNGLLAGTPQQVATWILSVALSQLLGLLWLDLLWARFGVDRMRSAESLVLLPLAASAIIASLIGLYQGHVDIAWLNPLTWSGIGRAGGTMNDANAFGTISAVWAASILALAWRLRLPIWLAAIATSLLAAAMWTSGSRTALLVLVIGVGGVMVSIVRMADARRRRVLLGGGLVAGVVILAAVALGPRTEAPTSPLQRLIDTLPEPTGPSVARFLGEMWARDGYGTAAVRAWREHPMSGIGIGAFHNLSPDYAFLAIGRPLPPDNAQNWWRHQIVELGLPGSVACLWFSGLVAWLAFFPRAPKERQPPATIVQSVVIGIGAASLLGLTTQHPVVFLTFVTLVFWLTGMTRAGGQVTGQRTSGWVAVWVLALLAVSGSAWAATHDLRVPARALRMGFSYAYGLSPPEPSADNGQLRWSQAHAVTVVPAQHRWLELTFWAPHPDLGTEPVRVRVWHEGRLVLDHRFTTPQPQTRILGVTEGQRMTMIELKASRTFGPGRAVRLASRWHRELPPGTPPERVVSQARRP